MARRSVLAAGVMLVMIVISPAVPLWAQQGEEQGTEPEEYAEDEFSPLLRNLRRGEIVMLGSFPLTLFLTLEGFDLYRFVVHSGESDASQYGFWPFPNTAPYSPKEITGIAVTALSASLLIAVADYFIGRARQKRPDR